MYQRMIHKRYRVRRVLLLFAVLILAILLALFLSRTHWDFFISSASHDRSIADAAARHNIDPLLLKALIWRESRFKANSRGSKGEIGLTQIRMETAGADWSEYFSTPISSEGELFNPQLNIEIGAWYLSKAMKRWRDFEQCEEMALAEYNAGYSRVKKWNSEQTGENFLDKIAFSPTRDYVEAIMEKYETYSNERN